MYPLQSNSIRTEHNILMGFITILLSMFLLSLLFIRLTQEVKGDAGVQNPKQFVSSGVYV